MATEGTASMSENTRPRYSRILVKLSGEALMGKADYGIDPAVLKRIAGEIQEITQMGVQVAVVIGGGNIFRGAGLARAGGHGRDGRHPRHRDRGAQPRRRVTLPPPRGGVTAPSGAVRAGRCRTTARTAGTGSGGPR